MTIRFEMLKIRQVNCFAHQAATLQVLNRSFLGNSSKILVVSSIPVHGMVKCPMGRGYIGKMDCTYEMMNNNKKKAKTVMAKLDPPKLSKVFRR